MLWHFVVLCQELMQLFLWSFSTCFHLVPFLIRKNEVQVTCIQSSLKTLKQKNVTVEPTENKFFG